jgi:hypothetical protein
LPADLTVEATGPEGAVVNFSGTARDDRDGDVPVTFSPGSGTVMVPIAIASSATDLVDPQPVIRIVAVASSEAEDGSGDGDTAPDWEIFGPLAVNLRAERAGGEPGRIYAITVAARDTSGNTSTRTVNVVVPASQGKSK